MRSHPHLLWPLCLLTACADSSPASWNPGSWPEEAASRGLDYQNHSGGRLKTTILEAGGAGVAMIDLESDGDLDLVFAQGLESLEQCARGPGADLEVFLNDGQGHFQRAPGPGISGWWTGLAAGDINGDGRTDLVAAGYGGIEVLVQNEAGELESWQNLIGHDGGEEMVPGAERLYGLSPLWGTSLALFDADGDGHLDLYLGHYLKLDPLNPSILEIRRGTVATPCLWKDREVFCGPAGLVPQPDRFFMGTGKGGFVHDPTRLKNHRAGFTLAVLPTDVDGDGDTDLWVAKDRSPSSLLLNDGKGFFHDGAQEAGIVPDPGSGVPAGHGLTSGDVNRDGLFDYAVTNFSDAPTALHLGSVGGFTNGASRYGLVAASNAQLSWSAHLEDFDGDGWLELYTANGHVYPEADEASTGTSYAQRDSLWRLGPQESVQIFAVGEDKSFFARRAVSRGSAVGDLNGDGRPDLVTTSVDGPCALGINNTGTGNHRLVVKLMGPPPVAGTREPGTRRTPRDAMGARVVLVVGEAELSYTCVQEVQTAQGYQSASSPYLHFGLGEHTGFQSLRVFWPSGEVTELPAGAGDRWLEIEEGRGVVSEREY